MDEFSLKPGSVNRLYQGQGRFVPVGPGPNPPLALVLPVVLPIKGTANPIRKT